MKDRVGVALVFSADLLGLGEANGQGPASPLARPAMPGGESSLGPSPGSISGGVGRGPDSLLGGRPGPSVPRVPSTITRPDRRGTTGSITEGIAPPSALPIAKFRCSARSRSPAIAKTRAPRTV